MRFSFILRSPLAKQFYLLHSSRASLLAIPMLVTTRNGDHFSRFLWMAGSRSDVAARKAANLSGFPLSLPIPILLAKRGTSFED